MRPIRCRTHEKKISRRKSSRAYTSTQPQHAEIVLLGTGWQRFRFRLGRPRAAAHVWGKGARILTEINRLPHIAIRQRQHKFGPKISSDDIPLLTRARANLSCRPLLLPTLFRRLNPPIRRNLPATFSPLRVFKGPTLPAVSGCAIACSARSSSSFCCVSEGQLGIIARVVPPRQSAPRRFAQPVLDRPLLDLLDRALHLALFGRSRLAEQRLRQQRALRLILHHVHRIAGLARGQRLKRRIRAKMLKPGGLLAGRPRPRAAAPAQTRDR